MLGAIDVVRQLLAAELLSPSPKATSTPRLLTERRRSRLGLTTIRPLLIRLFSVCVTSSHELQTHDRGSFSCQPQHSADCEIANRSMLHACAVPGVPCTAPWCRVKRSFFLKFIPAIGYRQWRDRRSQYTVHAIIVYTRRVTPKALHLVATCYDLVTLRTLGCQYEPGPHDFWEDKGPPSCGNALQGPPSRLNNLIIKSPPRYGGLFGLSSDCSMLLRLSAASVAGAARFSGARGWHTQKCVYFVTVMYALLRVYRTVLR